VQTQKPARRPELNPQLSLVAVLTQTTLRISSNSLETEERAALAVFQAVADFPVLADFLVPAVAEVVKAADFRAEAVDFKAAPADSVAVVVAKAVLFKAVLFKAVAEIVVDRPYYKIGSAYTLHYCLDPRS
jgi:hypothetical protein